MKEDYIPQRGDAGWMEFDPQAGREQLGRRPAIVLSPASYNGLTNLAIVCPVTNRVRGNPFEVAIPDGIAITGIILVDHIKSVDWKARYFKFADKVPENTLREVIQKIEILLWDTIEGKNLSL